MKRKGYVFSLFVFMAFVSLLLIVVTHMNSISVMQKANYEELSIMKMSNIASNVAILMDEYNTLDCADVLSDLDGIPFIDDVDCNGDDLVLTSKSGDYVIGANVPAGGGSTIECSNNGDCPLGGPVAGTEFCQGGDVYIETKDYYCDDPGTVDSDCLFNTGSQLQATCALGCTGGVCDGAPPCVDECPVEGQRECVGANKASSQYRECVDGSDGCLEWGPATSCGSGQLCDDGNCCTKFRGATSIKEDRGGDTVFELAMSGTTRYLVESDSASVNKRCQQMDDGGDYGWVAQTYTYDQWCYYSNARTKYWSGSSWVSPGCSDDSVKTAYCCDV